MSSRRRKSWKERSRLRAKGRQEIINIFRKRQQERAEKVENKIPELMERESQLRESHKRKIKSSEEVRQMRLEMIKQSGTNDKGREN